MIRELAVNKRLLSSFVVLSILVAGFAFVSVQPARAGVSLTSLTSCISNGYSIAYDSGKNVAYIAEGLSSNKIAKINLGSVLIDGCSSVVTFSNVLCTASVSPGCGGIGNLAGGPFGLVILDGLLWMSAVYNGGVSVASYDTATGITTQYYYAGYSRASTLSTDGAYLYLPTNPGILKINPSNGVSSSLSTGHPGYFVLPVGSTLYFTTEDSSGLGKMNGDGTGLTMYNAGTNGVFAAQDSKGNIWFTGNNAHSLMELPSGGSSIESYATGMSGDGPYGLVVTSNGIYLAGYSNLKIRFWSNSISAVDAALDISTGDKPYAGFEDSLGNVWFFAVGSLSLVKIPVGIEPTTTTSTVTSTTTSGTITSTTTSVTTIVSVSVTTVTSTSTWVGPPKSSFYVYDEGSGKPIAANVTISGGNGQFFFKGPVDPSCGCLSLLVTNAPFWFNATAKGYSSSSWLTPGVFYNSYSLALTPEGGFPSLSGAVPFTVSVMNGNGYYARGAYVSVSSFPTGSLCNGYYTPQSSATVRFQDLSCEAAFKLMLQSPPSGLSGNYYFADKSSPLTTFYLPPGTAYVTLYYQGKITHHWVTVGSNGGALQLSVN